MSDARAMRTIPDVDLHKLMCCAVKSRDEDAASESRQSEAEDANDFACRLADELARRKAERVVWDAIEMDMLGIVGVAEPR